MGWDICTRKALAVVIEPSPCSIWIVRRVCRCLICNVGSLNTVARQEPRGGPSQLPPSSRRGPLIHCHSSDGRRGLAVAISRASHTTVIIIKRGSTYRPACAAALPKEGYSYNLDTVMMHQTQSTAPSRSFVGMTAASAVVPSYWREVAVTVRKRCATRQHKSFDAASLLSKGLLAFPKKEKRQAC